MSSTTVEQQNLSDTFSSYASFIERQYQLPNRQVTKWGKQKAHLIIFIKKHVPLLRLAELNPGQIEQIFRLLANRPPRFRDGKPISRSFARSLIREFRQFLRWLHYSNEYLWRLPEGYEARPVPITRLVTDLTGRSFSSGTYSKEELATLSLYRND
jgi:hypothetical protein